MNIEILRVYIIVLAGAGLFLALLPEHAAHAQLSTGGLTRGLPDLPRDLGVERRLKKDVEDVAATVEDTVPDAVATTVQPLAQQLTQTADAAVELVTRTFVADTDPAGNAIERDTVVVLVETTRLAELAHSGVILQSRRDLPVLGMTLLTLKKPASGSLPALVDELRADWPDATVDYNHVYTTSTVPPQAAGNTSTAADSLAPEPTAALAVGVIDSAVQTDHVMLQKSRIIATDFAVHEGLRPQTHGTAVASLIASSSKHRATIYAAGVFFQKPGYAPGATTDSLVAALEWLAAADVQVINMSLAGPGNQLLEAVVRRVLENEHIIVAAVGNNGPSGEPLYPGAYDNVIGVTAVDRSKKIFRYANRGDHVDFAARGVDVRVADSASGGLRIESGTSMASPHVAVVIAELLQSDDVSGSAVESWLIAGAEDLGRKGFDPVYGHGLITRPPVMLSAD